MALTLGVAGMFPVCAYCGRLLPMKEALDGSTHRHLPATTWVGVSSASFTAGDAYAGTCPSGVEGVIHNPFRVALHYKAIDKQSASIPRY